jgi:phytoene synthase
MGARSPESVARACDLGVAMQLSNVARDVGEDARAGRLYLPLGWLREAGIDPYAWLTQPVFSEALGSVVQRLLDAADALYARAAPGIAGLPRACRPGIHAARLLYAEIGREVEARGLDSVSGRAVVPSARKAALLARAFAAATLAGRGEPAPPLEETRFLVEAVANGSPRPSRSVPDELPWWNLGDRVVWVFELFERLDRRQEVGRGTTGGGT